MSFAGSVVRWLYRSLLFAGSVVRWLYRSMSVAGSVGRWLYRSLSVAGSVVRSLLSCVTPSFPINVFQIAEISLSIIRLYHLF